MARKISKGNWDDWEKLPEEIDKESVNAERANQFITQIRHYKLITPLFGGGAETKKADAVKIIRETEIRGQLRFWWRAIRGVGTIKEMLQRESEIFGTSASENGNKKLGESKVKVFVKIEKEGNASEPFFMNYRNFPRPVKEWEKIAYVAFPLQPTTDEIKKNEHLPMKEIVSGIEFELQISFPRELRKDVEAALWGWETFGGIGGRTRRGFGAIEILEIIEDKKKKPFVLEKDGRILRREKSISNDFITFYNENITEFTNDLAGQTINKNVPHLTLNSKFKFIVRSESKDAWEFLIGKLKDFRQARPKEKNRDRIEYGQSYWSEPDAIRHLYIKENADNKKKLGHLPKRKIDDVNNVNKFPRAVFGLPIVFHFMDKEGLPDTELKPSEKERLSSPLILKPVACEDGKYIALAFLLETSRLSFDEIHLITSKKRFDIGEVKVDLTEEEAKILTKDGLTLLKNERDILKAFLDTI